jgi:DUF177 domain-containing protein
MTVVIDVRDLIGQPGATREVRVEEPIAGLATGLAAVPEDQSVGAELRLESVMDGVVVSGPLSGVMRLSCARCLKSFDQGFALEVEELFAPGAAAEGDEYPLEEGRLDLEPMIRDAVVLAMPFAPLCRPDCLGLCARCGGDLNLGECRCPPESDLRWGPLSNLTLDED